jgi:hypothetical protein
MARAAIASQTVLISPWMSSAMGAFYVASLALKTMPRRLFLGKRKDWF